MAGGTQGTGRMNFQVPDEMRTMAERSVTQARQALENYLQAARRTSESMGQTSDQVQASSKDMAQKTLSAVEQNLRASLDYAERLCGPRICKRSPTSNRSLLGPRRRSCRPR